MINKKLINFKTKEEFLKSKDQIYDWSIVFIDDTREIWTHQTGFQSLPDGGTEGQVLIQGEEGPEWSSELDNKADIEDLSNVIGEEITDHVFDEFYIPTIIPSSGEILDVEVGKYYRFDEEVNNLTINLPTIEDINHLKVLLVVFTAGDTPAVTITSESNIAYFTEYSIEPNTTYEINLMFNGLKWIVAYGVIE